MSCWGRVERVYGTCMWECREWGCKCVVRLDWRLEKWRIEGWKSQEEFFFFGSFRSLLTETSELCVCEGERVCVCCCCWLLSLLCVLGTDSDSNRKGWQRIKKRAALNGGKWGWLMNKRRKKCNDDKGQVRDKGTKQAQPRGISSGGATRVIRVVCGV